MKFSALKFLKRATLTAAFAAASLGFYAYEVEPNMLKTTTYSIQSAKWNQGMPPLHIVAASDFHVGCPSVSLDRLQEIVDRINKMKPDVIVLPGDFVTMMKGNERVIGGEYVPPEDIAKVLKGLKAPLGVYAVLGNHDRMNEPDAMRDALEGVGIRVIDNDAVHVQKDGFDFWMVGLSDDTTSKPDWAKANAKIDNSAPVVVIMHDPGAFLDENNRPVVSIAAHTHGGQIVVPFVEHRLENPYSRAPMRYLYGHIVEGGRDLIVTSGIGTSIVPLRFGARPEIVDIEISANKDAPKTVVAQPKAPVKPGPG
jgi:predicted MPP superfamily phosphohydrolase